MGEATVEARCVRRPWVVGVNEAQGDQGRNVGKT